MIHIRGVDYPQQCSTCGQTIPAYRGHIADVTDESQYQTGDAPSSNVVVTCLECRE